MPQGDDANDDAPAPVDEPEAVPNRRSVLQHVYDEARAAGEPRPGEKAYRATVGAFVQHNQNGAPESARWDLIRQTQDAYRRAYFQLTGMNEELLDALLAGDAARAYASALTPPPEQVPVRPDDGLATPSERPSTSPDGPTPDGPTPVPDREPHTP
jgi:hypothetical protein